MSQSLASNQPESSSPASQAAQAEPKSSWGRKLALTGVALFVIGLFLGGLFKDSAAGTTIVRVVSFGGVGCLLVGLIGVAIDAIKKKRA